MTGPVDTIREALMYVEPTEAYLYDAAIDALTELEQQLADLKRGMETGDNLLSQCGSTLEAAETALAEANRKADEWERIAAERGTRMDEIQARAESAEQRANDLDGTTDPRTDPDIPR